MRAYIGQGLRADLERMESEIQLNAIVNSLRKRGVDEEILTSAIAEAKGEYNA